MKLASPSRKRPFPIFSPHHQLTGVDVEEIKENISTSSGSEDDSNCSGQDPDHYEVEKILSHRGKSLKDATHFLIKWENYPESQASWEPVSNLDGCSVILSEYYERFYSEPKKKRNKLSENQLKITKEQAAWLQRKLPPALDIIRFKSTGDGIHGDFTLRVNVKELKQQTWADLKAWERKVCEICRKGKEAELKVENDVDFEVIPTDFTYVIDYKEGEGVQIHKGSIIHILPNTFSQFRRPVRGRRPQEPPVGCQCGDGLCSSKGKTCCSALSGVEFAYDSKGKVKSLDGRPIYECNSKCACGPECLNRVVQKGRKFPLTIYRTETKGWAVKAQQRIPSHTFVTEYVGEVITEKVAEERGKAYDAAGATYLFDLDFNDSANVEFAVDAKKYGNVAHFINHSCDPNLEIRAVWNECLDERMPRLAFFSRRTIKRGEELTFNYRMHDSPSLEAVDEETSGTATKIPCLCGAENCRKYLN